MAFQTDCGSIIIDAVLTDEGRRQMANGKFKISKFALGDDEVDYSFYTPGDADTSQTGIIATPILEALGAQNANILYGLMNFGRRDILYMPQININSKIEGAVNLHGGRFLMAVNNETAKIILQRTKALVGSWVLENNKITNNFVFIESGINGGSFFTIEGNQKTKERFINNLGLMDQYLFVHADSRFIENILINNKNGHFKNDSNNILYKNFLPLERDIKLSLPAVVDKYEVYKMPTINNEIRQVADGAQSSLTSIDGPRGFAAALNFKIKDRMINDSTSAADDRYRKFGKLNQEVFGTSKGRFDYVDTNVMAEGATTGRRKIIPLRIIRYASA